MHPAWCLLCSLTQAGPGPAWATVGYGYAAEVRHDTLRVYETTDRSCLFSFAAVATSPGRFLRLDYPLTYVLTTNPEPPRLHVNGAASDMILRPLPALPSRCAEQPSNTPLSSFEIFVATWAEQYPFFAEKGAN